MQIGIIGAGWYGCHLGAILSAHGHEVTIYEAGDAVLQRASSLNQARLHAGYHYPRSYATRRETADCFQRFIATYPQFTRVIENNIYAVSSTHSVMDFVTYTHIMAALGLKFREVDHRQFGLMNVDGAMVTEERGLDFDKARAYFQTALGTRLHLGHGVQALSDKGDFVTVDGQRFDVVLNCTWCALATGTEIVPNLFYEPTTLFYYEATEPFYGALTTMDGACFSVYPYRDNIYTLSHVGHTPRGSYETFTAADKINQKLLREDLDVIRAQMVAEVVREFPSFPDRFRYVGVQKSIKTKYVNARASRETIVKQQGRVITVLSGKIDTIFVAEDAVLEKLRVMEHGVQPLNTKENVGLRNLL